MKDLEELFQRKLEKFSKQFEKKERVKDYPDLLTRNQVKEILNISFGTIRNMEEAGKLKRIVIHETTIRYKKEEVLNFLK